MYRNLSYKFKYNKLIISTINMFNDKLLSNNNVLSNIVEPNDINEQIKEMNLHKDRNFIFLLMESIYNDFSKNIFDINVFVIFLDFIKSILIPNRDNVCYHMELIYNLKKLASRNLYNSCLFLDINKTSLEDYLSTICDEQFLRSTNIYLPFNPINCMRKFNEIFTIYLTEGINDFNIYKFKEDFKNFLISKEDINLKKKVFMDINIDKLLYIFNTTEEIINFGIDSYYFILLNCRDRKKCIDKYSILLSESIKLNNTKPNDILSSYELFIRFNTDDFNFEIINSIYNSYNNCPIVLYNLSLFCSKLKQKKKTKFSFDIIEKIELNFSELENYFLYIGHYHSLLQETKTYKDILNDYQIKIITNNYENINLNLLSICYTRFLAGYFTDRTTLLYVNELLKYDFGYENNLQILEEFISEHVLLGLNGIGIIICLLKRLLKDQ